MTLFYQWHAFNTSPMHSKHPHKHPQILGTNGRHSPNAWQHPESIVLAAVSTICGAALDTTFSAPPAACITLGASAATVDATMLLHVLLHVPVVLLHTLLPLLHVRPPE